MSELQSLYVCKTTQIRELNLSPDLSAKTADITISNKSGNRRVVHRLDVSGNYTVKVVDQSNNVIRDVLGTLGGSDQSARITELEAQVATLTAQLASVQTLLNKLNEFATVFDQAIAVEGYGGYGE
jgi:hypothetical protein